MKDNDIFKDLSGYESEMDDIMGGSTIREYQTGVKAYKDLKDTPGMNQVEGVSNENQSFHYPILLLSFRTTEVLDKVKSILQLSQIEQSNLYELIDNKFVLKVDVLKSWEDGNATFIGTGILTHKRWLKLDRMGIRPLLYLEKGKYYKSKSGILFDFSKYKPLILEEDEDVEKNDDITPVRSVKNIDDLNLSDLKNKESRRIKDPVIPKEIKGPIKKEIGENVAQEPQVVEESSGNETSFDFNWDEIMKDDLNLDNGVFESQESLDDDKKEDSLEDLIPKVDFKWE